MKQEILSAIAGVIPPDNAIYISIPITTGSNFLEWYAQTGKSLESTTYKSRHREEVILPNIEKARSTVSMLRKRHPDKIIIEPTSLDVQDWSQEQYHDFWGDIIDRFANTIYLTPGWYYSRGCAYEFMKACQKGIAMLDIEANPVTITDGIELIKSAVSEYQSLELDSEFLSNITSNLDALNNGEKPSLQR